MDLAEALSIAKRYTPDRYSSISDQLQSRGLKPLSAVDVTRLLKSLAIQVRLCPLTGALFC